MRVLRLLALVLVLPLSALGLAHVDRSLETSAAQAPAPGLHVMSFMSKALHGRINYAVWLPRDYRRSRRRYPVVYLLHGLPDTGRAFRDSRVADIGTIAQRAGRPVIVVAPQGARRSDTDAEWRDWGPGRNWETATAVELVKAIDSRFRTIADRRDRALIGISAGGYGATLTALHHPETYSVIESWSGYFQPTDPDGQNVLDLGSAQRNLQASAHAFVPCLARMVPSDRPKLIGFFVGDQDTRFLDENRRLDAELTAASVPHRFAVYPGAHDDTFWDAHERDWLMAGVRLLPSRQPQGPQDAEGVRDRARGAGCPVDEPG